MSGCQPFPYGKRLPRRRNRSATLDRVALPLAMTCAGLLLLTACTFDDTSTPLTSPPEAPSFDQPLITMDLAADIAWEKVLARFPDATRPDDSSELDYRRWAYRELPSLD